MSARLLLPAALAALLLVGPIRAEEPIKKVAAVEGCTEHRLPNGLRVLLLPDDSRPIVTVNMVVLVGSRHEGYGETGMAHLLEHMCIKSTPTHPNIMKAVREHGGSDFNAYTRNDSTNFIETMPATAENLEFGIRLEADRLLNCDLKREDLMTEMTVVRSEFEQGENSPLSILGQRMRATMFEWHNYGKELIGNKSDIEQYPIESLRAFYKKHYRVDNALLIVTGKFDEKSALELAVRHFGPLKKPATPLPPTYTTEPAQDGEREVSLRRVGKGSHVAAAYHVPAASHPDFAAVEILARCLGRTPDGRLHQSLVRDGSKATAVGGTASALHDPGFVIFEAQLDDAAKLPAARDGLLKTLENLAERPITADEVAKTKSEYKSAYDAKLLSTKGMATELGVWSGLGDWRLFFVHRDRLQAVTADDVNRVAAAYLKRENRTVGVLHPTEKPDRADVPAAPAIASIVDGYKGNTAVAAVESFEATPENIERRTVRGRIGGIKTAYLRRPTRGGDVSFSLAIRFGNEDSLKGKDSAVEWLGSMLLHGTKGRPRQQFLDEWNRLEAGVRVNSDIGVLTLTGNAKKERLAETLRLLVEMLREPAFPAADFEELKRQAIAGAESVRNEPELLSKLTIKKSLYPYPKGHIRYQLDIEEGIAQAKGTTLDEVKALYAEQLGAVGELAVVGDFDPGLVEEVIGKGFAGWKPSVPYRRVPYIGTPAAKGDRVVVRTPDKANAFYRASMVAAMDDMDPDYAVLLVGNHLLGGRADNRLFNRVRVEKGLSYGVSSGFDADTFDKTADFQVTAICNPANIAKVRELIADELRLFVEKGVTADEAAAARKELIQQMDIALSTESAQAGLLRSGLHTGRPTTHFADFRKRIEAVTADDIKRAFGKWIDPRKLLVVEAGDFPK